jgi:hypothetical protein
MGHRFAAGRKSRRPEAGGLISLTGSVNGVWYSSGMVKAKHQKIINSYKRS